MPSSGSAAGRANIATSCVARGLTATFPGEDRPCASTPTSPRTKLHWLLENVPGVRERAAKGELLFGTVETWLIWKLTGGRAHVTDYSNASRTMLFNINDARLGRGNSGRAEHPARPCCPKPLPSSGLSTARPTRRSSAAKFRSPARRATSRRPSSARPASQPGEAKNTYGTGCFLLMNTGEKPVFSQNGLVTTIAWGLGEQGDLRARRLDLRRRRGHPVAARRDEADRDTRRSPSAGRAGGRGHERLLRRPGVHGPWRAAIGISTRAARSSA